MNKKSSTRRSVRLSADFTQTIHFARYKLSDTYKDNNNYANEHNEKLHLSKFINQKFHCIKCRHFVQDPMFVEDRRCFCGEMKKNHKRDKAPYNQSRGWNKTTCIETSPTDSFGKIEFIGEDVTNTKLTEFVRLSYLDGLDDVLKLMFNCWNIEIGTLCISVIGGAKHFKMRKKDRNIFCEGLITAVKTTNALIITSGLDLGTTKLVGDAIQNGQSQLYDKTKHNNFICCLGISPWRYVKNNLILENARGKIVQYKISNEAKSEQPDALLNKNHTHYLFVDEGCLSGITNSEAGNFRAMLESKLSEGTADRAAIPVVLLIVEGGHDVFIEASRSIRANFPIVICEGTGRASDILAEAFREMQKHTDNRTIRPDGVPMLPEEYKKMLRKKLVEMNVSESSKVEEAIKYIESIVHREYLITLCDMQEKDLDVMILYSLIKRMNYISDSKHNTILKQLSLCILWNRVDIAKDRIFSGMVSLSGEEWAVFLHETIRTEKVEFVELFLQNGAAMQDFLTTTTLRKLYEECPRSDNFMKTVLRLLGRNFSNGLSDIKDLLSKIVGKFDDPCFASDSEITHPFQELFIWSVLMEKHESANFYWIKTEESLCLALVATKIYQCLAETSPLDKERTQTLNHWKDYFENLAIKLLEECYDADQETAAYIIEKENEHWGGYTCLELAYKAKDEKFISCMVCQNSIDFTWRAGFNINLFDCITCIFFPFMIYKRSYDTGYVAQALERSISNKNDNYIKKSLNWSIKLKRFYSAPQTKFCIHSLAFLVFVLYFSYVVLFGMKRMLVTDHEMIFMIYLVCMMIEKICEMFRSRASRLQDRIKYWWNFNNWNKIDIFIIILSLVAILLRLKLLIPNEIDVIVLIYRCSKTCYSIIVGYFYLRILHMLVVNKQLGPKIVMITKMFREMILYLIIVLIITLSYGVTAQGSFYTQRDFSTETLANIVDYPFWTIFGEITLEKLVYFEWCNENTNFNISTTCPEDNYFIPVLTAAYMFTSNVLLISLLIAVFSYIFRNIQRKSIDVWKFTMYSLVIEYDLKAFCPLPFSIFIYLADLLSFIYRKNCKKNFENDFSLDTTSRDSQMTFEKKKKPKLFTFGKSLKMPLESELDKLVKYFENSSQKCVVKEMVVGKERSIEAGMSNLEYRLKSMTTIIKNIDAKMDKLDSLENHSCSGITGDNRIESQMSKEISENVLTGSLIEENLVKTNQEISSILQELKVRNKINNAHPRQITSANIPAKGTNTYKQLKDSTKVSKTSISPLRSNIIDEEVSLSDATSEGVINDNCLDSLIDEFDRIDAENIRQIQTIYSKIDTFKQEMEESMKTIEYTLKNLQN